MSFELEKIRALFPVTRNSIYLNHAGTGPMTITARKVITECLDVYGRQAEFNIEDYFFRVENARAAVARFIGAGSQEITFTHSTSQGIYIALVNLPLHAGDTVLVMDEVFPSVRYIVDYNIPLVNKRYISFSGKDAIAVIDRNLDRTVKAVVLDYAQYLTGEMVDLKGLGTYLREKDVFLIVDGIQVIGATDFNVQDFDIDFLACGAAKWLFGPSGTGFLYVNERNIPILKRQHTGWLGAEWLGFEDCEQRPGLYNDARMFEQGTRNIIGISALTANCQMFLDYGMPYVSGRIQLLKQRLRRRFESLQMPICTPANGPQSGIIAIKPAHARKLYKELQAHGIVIALRSECLRFSPHFYNTEAEIDQVLDLLEKSTG